MSPGFDLIKDRASMLAKTRAFFAERSVLEVDVATLIPYPQLDAYIEPIKADSGYLHTSPEYEMKKLLAAVPCDIYQLTHVFRKEEIGRVHLAEFTMIEWYRMQKTLIELSEETLALIQLFLGEKKIERCTFSSLWDAFVPPDAKGPKELLFDDYIASNLSPEKLYVVEDFPTESAALAKIENGVAKRFEIYLGGLELANGFWELSCPVEIKKRFETQNALREKEGKGPFPIDEAFVNASANLPDCVGVSVGFDRLMMQKRKEDQVKNVFLSSITGS